MYFWIRFRLEVRITSGLNFHVSPYKFSFSIVLFKSLNGCLTAVLAVIFLYYSILPDWTLSPLFKFDKHLSIWHEVGGT